MTTHHDYIFIMHHDAIVDEKAWEPYLRGLQRSGFFEGGSAIGEGVCVRKNGAPPSVTEHLAGFIRVKASSLDQAKSLLTGNPVFEAGGTVEIRELPRTE
jgi:YCII-related domain